MKKMIMFLSLFLLSVGCTENIVTDDVVFACKTHEDCSTGWKCSNECVCVKQLYWDHNTCKVVDVE